MAEQFGVELDGLRAVSTGVGELGSRVGGVVSAAQARIAAKGLGEGGGTLGGRFADGSTGWVSHSALVAASVGAKAALLTCYAERLTFIAEMSERSERL